MRIALFSDVHANPVALDAVLADMDRQRVDVRILPWRSGGGRSRSGRCGGTNSPA